MVKIIMRLCNKCGSEVPENSAFCHGCGERYEESNVTQGANADASESLGSQGYSGYPGQTDAFSHQNVQQGSAPINPIKTNRSLVRIIIFTIITFGIYLLVFHHGISRDINNTASRYDGKKTMNFVLMIFIILVPSFFIAIFTIDFDYFLDIGMVVYRSGAMAALSTISSIIFGIPLYVWYHRISNRIGAELTRRGLESSFNSAAYWTFYGVPSVIYWLISTATSLLSIHLPIIMLGSFAVLILSLVYFHKLCVAFNQLAEHYNVHG